MALSARSDNLYGGKGIIGTSRIEHLNDPKKASIQPLSYLYSVSSAFFAILFTQNTQARTHFFRHIILTKHYTSLIHKQGILKSVLLAPKLRQTILEFHLDASDLGQIYANQK